MRKDLEKLEVSAFRKLTDLKNKKILEIGCGDGRLTLDLYEFSKDIIAIDPDKDEVAKAWRAYPAINFQVGNGEKLIFLDRQFDIVIFSLSLHHHEIPEKALQESFRVLKNDGVLLVEEPIVGSELDAFFSLLKDEEVVVNNAYNALSESNFNLIDKLQLEVPTPFKDLDDFHNYYKDRAEFTEKIWHQMLELLEGVNTDSEFTVMDEVVIYKLVK